MFICFTLFIFVDHVRYFSVHVKAIHLLKLLLIIALRQFHIMCKFNISNMLLESWLISGESAEINP